MARSPRARDAQASDPRNAARTSASRQGEPGARLPHERDQSADAQAAGTESNERIGEKAYDDASSGRSDTSLAPVTDRVYRKLKGA